MATEPVIELEPLLVPIGGDNPSGRSLVYEPEYDALREARRSEDDTNQGDWAREVKAASWDQVIELGSTCLTSKSKDLQIAAWITEALTHLHGLAGLRDGLTLIRELIDRFWDTLFPEIDDGDLDYRAAPIEFLNQDRTLPLVLREIPLTAGARDQNYSFLHWQESRALDNLGKRNAEKMQEQIADGKITGEQFDEAVKQTPRAFYEALNGDLDEAWDAYRALNSAFDARFGKDAPSLSNVRKAFEDVRKVLVPILNVKRAEEPGDEPEGEPDETSDPDDEAEAHDGWGEAEPEPIAESPATVGKSKPGRRSTGGPIADAGDAVNRILDATAYLRQNEPASPVPFAVVRALRLAELYGLGESPGPDRLASPASETRQTLKRLAAEGDWDTLLEEAEQALGRPEGRAWLDAHRYALAAMANSTTADRSAAIGFGTALLRTVLTDFPDLPDAELADDTPTANAETRAWLAAEVLSTTAPPRGPEPYVPPPEPVHEPAHGAGVTNGKAEPDPDPWELALEDVKNGNPADGFRRLRAATARATSGRERFRRKLQMAELCLTVGNQRVALSLLEELAGQVDEFRLEHWEDESLCARVWGALYRCLRDLGADGDGDRAERLQEVYSRLCRLDINQALSYDNG